MRSKAVSLEQYLELMADASKLKVHHTSVQIIERFKNSLKVSNRYAPVLFLLDYTTKKYLFIDNGVWDLFGYGPEHLYEIGLQGYLNSWHPADFKVMNERVFPDNINFLKALPIEKYGDIIFTQNYRLQNALGEYIMILQRYSYIPSYEMAMPFGVIGIAVDITHYKTDFNIVHTIEESISINGEWVNKLLLKKTHPVYDDLVFTELTKRERELLKYLTQGLSSKQIAEKMGISINTVNNHRKNMLAKTHCKSSSELTNYAVRHGLL